MEGIQQKTEEKSLGQSTWNGGYRTENRGERTRTEYIEWRV